MTRQDHLMSSEDKTGFVENSSFDDADQTRSNTTCVQNEHTARDDVYPITSCLRNFHVFSKKKKSYYLPCDSFPRNMLKNINLLLTPGSFTGVLGVSGSGKTTLLNALALRYPSDRCSGIVSHNNFPKKLISQKISYIMVQDKFLPYLTVQETMETRATLTMPNLSATERSIVVKKLLNQFHLNHCRNTFIGGDWYKGISTGERKRLSVALSMMNNPSLLLLDEPTSGLDCVMALNVIEALLVEARRGRTVVVTIHQPSSQIFDLFDNLIVLSNGSCVYCGPTSEIVNYFEKIGYSCYKNWNPSDFVINLLNPPKEDGFSFAQKIVSETPLSHIREKQSSEHIFVEAWSNSDEAKNLEKLVDVHLNNNKGHFLNEEIEMENFNKDEKVKPVVVIPQNLKQSYYKLDDTTTMIVKKQLSSNNKILETNSDKTKVIYPPKEKRYSPILTELSVLMKQSFLNSIRNPVTVLFLFLIQAMQGLTLGGIFYNQTPPQTQTPVEPYISSSTWENSKWLKAQTFGLPKEVSPNYPHPLLSMYREGVGPKGSYILGDNTTSINVLQERVLKVVDKFSSCLYKNMALPERGYFNLSLLLKQPASNWNEWTSERIYSNIAGYYQIFDYKYSLGPNHFPLVSTALKECNLTTDIPMEFYLCLLIVYKPHFDVFAECLELLPLPSLDNIVGFEIPKVDAEPLLSSVRKPQSENKFIEENPEARAASEYLNMGLKFFLHNYDEFKDLTYALSKWFLTITTCDNMICEGLNSIKNATFNWGYKAQETLLSAFHLSGRLFFLSTIIGFASYDTLLSFPRERCLFNREMSDKLYRGYGYFIAKNIAELPFQIGPSLIMAIIYYFLSGFSISFVQILTFLIVCVLTSFCGYGFGYMVSAASPRMEVAFVVAPLTLVCWLVISGYFLRDNDIPVWIYWFKYFSFYRWSYFSFAINQFPPNKYFGAFSNDFLLSATGVTETRLVVTLLNLFLLGCLYRILAYFFLMKINRTVGLDL